MSAALVFILRQREIMNRFRNAGAIAPPSARRLSDIGVRPGFVFSQMARAGVFVRTEQDCFWMDQAAGNRFESRRGRRMLLVVVVVLGLAALAAGARMLW